MKKFKIGKSLLKIIPYIFTLIGIVLLAVTYTMPFNDDFYFTYTYSNVWSGLAEQYLFIVLLVGLVVQLIFLVLAVTFHFIKKFKFKKIVGMVSQIFAAVFAVAVLLVYMLNAMYTMLSLILCIVNIVLGLTGVVLFFLFNKKGSDVENPDAEEVYVDKGPRNPNNIVILILSIISLVLTCVIFAVPLYSVESLEALEIQNYYLFNAMFTEEIILPLYVSFIAFISLLFCSVLIFIITIKYFFRSGDAYLQKTKKLFYLNLIITVGFFLVGYLISFISRLSGADYSSISYIPLLIMVLFFFVYYIFVGRYTANEPTPLGTPREHRRKKLKRIESVIYILMMTLICAACLVVDLLKIHFEAGTYLADMSMDGLSLLQQYATMSAGMQALAFVEFILLMISGISGFTIVICYLGKVEQFNKFVKTAALINLVIMFLVGICGMYFSIGQKLTVESVRSVIETYLGYEVDFDFDYSISSDTLYLFFGDLMVFVLMVFRGVFSEKTIVTAEPAMANNAPGIEANASAGVDKKEPEKEEEDESKDFNYVEESTPEGENYDVCPAFTEIDFNKPIFDDALANRLTMPFDNPTLKDLTEFVVDYARNSRLHLSYTNEDIATFIAGLGASRLSILQGMSGTGKTSLPKIFIEAIMGNCEIVEVESSWRDKNELLGYYNEFSKSYTPKKFTQSLYRATLNSEVITLIVLDEMNLSRIEYYFSDFLSLMENEEDKREIKLLNVKLFRVEDGERKDYLGLTNGHTIKIPKNVWFIGTANRDESTFEISDKVYDRAQTMNFNKRAPKVKSFQDPIDKRFLSYPRFAELLKEAKQSATFDIETDRRIQEAERLLAPYNISFGNRVLNQMEEFIKIYCACLKDKPDVAAEAVEKILLSKVVSKLEFKNVEDKDTLAQEFDNVSLHLCSAFIRKLNGE